jgi:hypothetical protein
MSATNIPFTLTTAGIDAAFNLGALDLNVTHVQIGSGNRVPNGAETALVNPQEYAAISGVFEVSVGQHRIAALIAGSASAYNVSEIGLWAGVPGGGGSVLVFYWSQGSGYVAVKSVNIDFNFESDIFFGGVVPTNITIVADTQFNALAMLSAHEADPQAHPAIETPPLGDNDQSPVNSEWVQQTIGKVLSKSIAGGVDVTLTAVEAGHGILKFTGAITANISVVVPTSPTRSWIVDNETSGAFTLTIKTAAGTGVVAAQSGETGVYTDGVNVLYASGIVPQAEAEAGTATTLRGWTAQRVKQAINSSFFAAGTRLLFAQASAPVGWTQVATDEANNRMLRVVNTAGAGVGGSHSPILNSVVPSHTHGFTTGGESADHNHSGSTGGRSAFHVHAAPTYATAGSTYQVGANTLNAATYDFIPYVPTGNDDGDHVHAFTTGGISANHTHSGSTDNGSSQTNWTPRYIDLIMCSKN